MKILIIRNYPSYMDVKNNSYNIQEVGLAKALVRKGHKCDVLFWTDKEETFINLNVDNYGIVTVYYKKGITKLKNTVFLHCDELFEKYDVLQPCEYNQIESWILAKKYPNKTVIYHGPYYSSFNKRYNLMCSVFDKLLLWRYLNLDTKFIAKSNLAKRFLTNKKIKKENVKTIGVGIDLQMLTSPAEKVESKLYSSMKTTDSKLKILYVGRFEKRRNIPFIFDVLKKVLEFEPSAKLFMVGTGEEELVKSYFDYAKKLSITDNICWEERVPQKYLSHIYSLSDFFLLPTEYEIFGMVLMEAMYYKNVVITNDNGGSSTLIVNGSNGIIINELKADKWAEALVALFNDKNKMNTIKQNASNRILEDFTWDALADSFIKQYSERIGYLDE